MTTHKTLIHTCIASALLLSGNAFADNVNAKLGDLHKRLQQVETSQDDPGPNVEVHGLIEVEYGYGEDYSGVDGSDIALATIELAISSSINDNVDAEIVLLHEEDDTPLEVDSGYITLHDENSPFSAELGQMYVHFGSFDTNLVSDPLTLELGETRESIVQFNYGNDGLLARLYLFNGDIEEGADEDKANKFGLSLAYESDSFNAGVDYINSISDTDSIQEIITNGPGTVIDHVAGLSAHASFSTDTVTVIFEYVGAMDQFDASEIAFKGVGAEPSAMNLEFAMNMPFAGRDSTVAIGYQTTSEALALDLPESRILLAYSMPIYDSTLLAFEYQKSSDYNLADGGTDETAYTYTVQLATEF